MLNGIHLAGVATPMLYVYLLLRLDVNINKAEILVWAFFLGLFVDIFSDTSGVNASATVFLAFVRPVLIRLFVPRDLQDEAEIIPSFATFGVSNFMKYTVFCVLLHHIFVLTIEYFSFGGGLFFLFSLIGSSILTVMFVTVIEFIRR